MAGNAGTLFIDIRANLAAFEKDMGRLANSFAKQARTFKSVGDSLTKSFSLPIAAGAAAAIKAADSIGKAQRTIVAKTGATGTALKELETTYKNVANAAAVSFDDAAKATAGLSVSTGQTGKALEELATTATSLAKLTGEDLNGVVAESGKVFNAWNVSTEDQVRTLNVFYRASQQTGASVTELMGAIAGSDEVFQTLGFSMEESVALLGSFNKAGIDSETAINGLQRAIIKMSKEGITDLEGGFRGILEVLKSAPTDSKAFADAVEVFGKKNGLDLADALREGRFEIDALVSSISGSANTIIENERATRTWSDTLQILQNAFISAFEPIGKVLIDNKEGLINALTQVGQGVAAVAKWFTELSPSVQAAVINTALFAAALGPVLTWIGNILSAGSGFINFFKDIILLGAKAQTGFALLPATLAVVAGAFGGLFAGALIAGGDFQKFLRGFVEFTQGVFLAGIELAKEGFVKFLEILGYGPQQIKEITDRIKQIWAQFIQDFTRGLQVLSERWNGFWNNFRRGIGVLGQKFGADSWVEWAAEGEKAAAGVTQELNTVVEQTTKLSEGITKVGQTSNTHLPNVANLFSDTKEAAKEAAKAIKDLEKSLADSKADANIDRIKDSIDKLVKSGGSGADLGGLFGELSKANLDKILAQQKKNLEALSGEELKNAQETINKINAYEVETYKRDVANKQLEADMERHKKAVSFFQGLMEDIITGTRFDWVEQMKKAAAEIAAEWLANLIEANLLGSQNFGDLFSKIIGSLGDALSSWFGNSGLGDLVSGATGGSTGGFFSALFGGSAGSIYKPGEFVGPTQPGVPSTPVLVSGTSSAGLSAAAQTFGVAAAAAFGAYLIHENISNFGKAKTNEQKGAAGVTAAIDTVFPGIGTAISKLTGGLFGGDALTPNEQSLKAFEGAIEKKLKEAFGKSLNFVIGDIEKFAQPGWADKFWNDFGDKGGDVFSALGQSFEQMMGLEKGVGQQIGALLAENLAGGDLFASLDNIKLFLDSIGVSTEQLNEALLQTAKAGNISWHEFESFRQAIEKIPAEGLSALGNVSGAMDQITQSGGRGMQALIGLKNLAIEAGEAGITSFDGLRDALLAAGYDAETVSALFQALGQRGITSLDQLKDASDPALGGVIADMESLGVKWETFTEGADEANKAIGNLADQIRHLADVINQIPTHVDVEVQQHFTGDGGGAVQGFSKGGVFNGAHVFRMANGGVGMLGEAGPEAILPLKRINGKLGVQAAGMGANNSPTYEITIDARGADAGVERRLMMAMETVRGSLMRDVAEGAAFRARRGAF